MQPRLTGFPYRTDRATRLGGLPHLSSKHDQIKMKDYMERRATSPSWGPPPPGKQALDTTTGFCIGPSIFCSPALAPASCYSMGTISSPPSDTFGKLLSTSFQCRASHK